VDNALLARFRVIRFETQYDRLSHVAEQGLDGLVESFNNTLGTMLVRAAVSFVNGKLPPTPSTFFATETDFAVSCGVTGNVQTRVTNFFQTRSCEEQRERLVQEDQERASIQCFDAMCTNCMILSASGSPCWLCAPGVDGGMAVEVGAISLVLPPNITSEPDQRRTKKRATSITIEEMTPPLVEELLHALCQYASNNLVGSGVDSKLSELASRASQEHPCITQVLEPHGFAEGDYADCFKSQLTVAQMERIVDDLLAIQYPMGAAITMPTALSDKQWCARLSSPSGVVRASLRLKEGHETCISIGRSATNTITTDATYIEVSRIHVTLTFSQDVSMAQPMAHIHVRGGNGVVIGRMDGNSLQHVKASDESLILMDGDAVGLLGAITGFPAIGNTSKYESMKLLEDTSFVMRVEEISGHDKEYGDTEEQVDSDFNGEGARAGAGPMAPCQPIAAISQNNVAIDSDVCAISPATKRTSIVKAARSLLVSNGFKFSFDMVSAIVYLEALPGFDACDIGATSLADAIARLEELEVDELIDANHELLDHLGLLLAGDHEKSSTACYVLTCAVYATFFVPNLVGQARRTTSVLKRKRVVGE
jgi:hypothetical protein